MREMPEIKLESLEGVLKPEEMAWALDIVAGKGKNKGRLRASKPGKDSAPQTRYIWRQVAFSISPMPQHQCFPVTDLFDLHDCVRLPNEDGPGWVSEANEYGKYLDTIADKVINIVPVQQWHGVKRWGEAFGVLGAPRLSSDGSIIYRIGE